MGGLSLIAFSFVVFATLIPLDLVLDLYAQPLGAGIRPMNWPLQFILYGCGAPVLAACVALEVFKRTKNSPRRFHDRIAPRAVVLVICVTSVVPLLLTTVGMHWVIQEWELWLKP